MTSTRSEAAAAGPPPQLQQNVRLAPFTTFQVGGPADFFLEVETLGELRAAVDWARASELPLFILGGGSNLLVSDEGIRGLVVHVGLRGIAVKDEGSSVLVTAAAGEPWDSFVAFSVERGLAGVECLSGIPGYVGATPIQNVGAYGQDVSETIVSVEVLDLSTSALVTLTNADCVFDYRMSIFKGDAQGRYVVLAVTYRLSPEGAPAVRYPELQRYLDESGLDSTSLGDVREAVLAIRRRKGMVLDPADPDTRSAGSFFMNPVVGDDALASFLDRARRLLPDVDPPRFPAGEGRTKLSAAWLIERAGFHKGYGEGAARLSTKHTLALTNRGGATAGDIRRLCDEIRERVRDTFGIELHPEPNFVGDAGEWR